MYPRLSRNPVLIVVFLGLYFCLGRLSLATSVPGAVAAIWPPSGLALAGMLIFGRAIWPAVFAGALLVYLTTTGQVAVSVVLAAGAAFEAFIGGVLLDRVARGARAFNDAPTVFRFTTLTALVISPISAVSGATATTILHPGSLVDVVYVGTSFWLASLTGILVVTPFVTLWATSAMRRPSWREALESVALFALLTGVGLVVFGGKFPSDVKNYPLEFLCVPCLLWAAFRFGRRVASTVTLELSGIAVWGTLHGFGPFARDSANEAYVLVQAYVCVMAVMAAVLAAVVAEHKKAQAQLRTLATTDSLTGLVNYRRLIEVLRAEIARSQRTTRPFAVLFVDMNGLKRINDRHGHLVGSRALCRVADAIRRSCRAIDTPARFGGDEFAVVLPETGEDGGLNVLTRLADRLAMDKDKPRLGVSGGVAVFPRDGESPTLLLRAADAALYAAKAQAHLARRDAPPAEPPLKTGTLF